MSRTTMQFVITLNYASRNSPQASRQAWKDCSPSHHSYDSAYGHRGESGEGETPSHICIRDQWRMDVFYTTLGGIQTGHSPCGRDIIFQLLECCDQALRKDLTRSFNNPTSYDETTLLGHIKSLAVRQENVMVACLHLQQMRQDRDEPARTFSARLFVCLFGFLTSSSTTRLYRGRAPRQERLTILRAATHETELGDHDFCLSRSHYTDTDPTCRERAATAGIEPGTSSPGVARSTAELPRPPSPPASKVKRVCVNKTLTASVAPSFHTVTKWSQIPSLLDLLTTIFASMCLAKQTKRCPSMRL